MNSASFQLIPAASLAGTPSLTHLSVLLSWLPGSSPPAAGMMLLCLLSCPSSCWPSLGESELLRPGTFFYLWWQVQPMPVPEVNTGVASRSLVRSIYLSHISIKIYIITFNNLNLFPWQLGKVLLIILGKASTTLRFNPLNTSQSFAFLPKYEETEWQHLTPLTTSLRTLLILIQFPSSNK